jgi:LacI family kdg operon repressor
MEKKETSKLTIYDVAKAAGVSKSTVSRYLSGRFHEISENTKQKIQEVIEQLNYKPNHMARGLKGNKSFLIGAIVADITNPYTTAILRGAEDICKENGYALLICNSDNNPLKEKEYISMLQAHQIDGLIIQTTGGNNQFLEELFNDGDTPIVLVDRKVPELSFDIVGIDNQQATYRAVSYLQSQNYERIAWFTEPVTGISVRKERFHAFQEALKLQDVNHPSLEDTYVADLKKDSELERCLEDFLGKTKHQSRVIFGANSVILLKIILALQSKGIKVPEDVSLIGFDNPEWASVVYSGITTIEQPTSQIGKSCADLILKRINGTPLMPQTLSYHANLIQRGSTPAVNKYFNKEE